MPAVSLALPVYNGEKYIDECIKSILSQTFEDFELVVSDNASTDGTYDILKRFADIDKRIRIIRQPVNVGAAQNFNLLFEETTAEIFKWCAYDDRIEPTFIQETYDALMREPDAVLCHSHTIVHDMDKQEKTLFIPKFTMPVDDSVARLRDVFLHGQRCYEVFGLIRRSALDKTGLIYNYRGGDNVLLYRLSLIGRFLIVPKGLFILGRHSEQSTALLKDSRAYHAWFTGRNLKFGFPDWVFLIGTWGIMRGLNLKMYERLRCYRELIIETYRRRARLRQNVRVAVETLIFGNSDPQRRRRLFGSSRGY